MEIGNIRNTTELQDTFEEFLTHLDNEYNHIQVYFVDLFAYSKKKKEEITAELSDEDFEIKTSILKQPHYSLYQNKFEDILAKSTIVTLISNFESNLTQLIELLLKVGYINDDNFKKSRNGVVYNCLEYLYTKSPIDRNYIEYVHIEFFIKLRNSIVHNNSEINDQILNHPNFPIYQDHIIIREGQFYFNDNLINHFLLKTSKTFFNSFTNYIK